MRFFSWIRGVLLGLCVVVLVSGCICGPDKDISLDPHSTFNAIQGRTYRLKKKMLAYQKSADETHGADVWLCDADDGVQGKMPLAIVPVGTRIRVTNAFQDNCESGGTLVYVEIKDGSLAGKRAVVVSINVFLNPDFTVRGSLPVKVWTANLEWLDPVDGPDTRSSN
jgi:hypothetical protein